MASSLETYLPRWTRRVAMEGSGRDPLGLSRVSDEFTGFLLPSIITTTPRARYFSFYPWAIEQCNKTLEDDGSRSFGEIFRCIDTSFAISSYFGKRTDLTITGIDEVRSKLPDPSSEELFDTLFPVLPSSERGAFGQAYGSSIDHLGMIEWSEDDDWQLSEGRGDVLASVFADAVKSAPYLRGEHAGQQWVPSSVFKDSSKTFSLDGIREPSAKNERKALTRIFFDLDDEDATNPHSHRQATLGLFLHVLEAYEEVGVLPIRRNVNAYCIIWPHYYGRLDIGGSKSKAYKPFAGFEESRGYWQQFCLHQFFLYAAEQFLQAMLDVMGTHSDGASKPEMLEGMLNAGFVEDLEKVTGRKLKGPVDLLDYYGLGESPESVQKKFSADHPLSEGWIYYSGGEEEDRKTPITRLGCAFAIWAQLYTKWRHSDDPAFHDVAERASQEWWAGTSFMWTDDWVEEKPIWSEVIGSLIDIFVSRHEQVRFHKGKLDAAWFEILDRKFHRIQDLWPDFRSSRHPQVVTVFQDLCLLEDGGLDDPLKITSDGKRTLKEVMRARP